MGAILRHSVWGAVIGLAAALGIGHAAAWYDNQWPFNHNKTASHVVMDFTRTVAAPIGVLAGSFGGALLVRLKRGRWMPA